MKPVGSRPAAFTHATTPGGLRFQLFPHLDVALCRPDTRIIEANSFVIRARDVERHAVVKDDPVAVTRLHKIEDLSIDSLQVFSIRHAPAHRPIQIGLSGLDAAAETATYLRVAATTLISTMSSGRASEATPRMVHAGKSERMYRSFTSRNTASCDPTSTW